MRQLYQTVLEDLEKRETGLEKPHRKGIGHLVASLLISKTPNLMVLGETIDRKISTSERRYRYVSRQLANPRIKVDAVMKSYATEVIGRVHSNNETIILMMDQSQIGNGFECLMVSIRVGDRALPVLWRIQKTEGNIGFEIQKELLESISHFMPEGAKIILMADRFYGMVSQSLLGISDTAKRKYAFSASRRAYCFW
jgi:hypothetical protein